MAKDIWISDTDGGDVNNDVKVEALIVECLRQEESCLYTSTTLYIWLRRVRLQKQIFVALPVILGAAAGLSLLRDLTLPWVSALLAFAAGLFPALADALSIETRLDETSRLAAEFKSLQDRFRKIARITAPANIEMATREFADLMDRLDIARSTSITPPEWAFRKAQKKISDGHYDFKIDTVKHLPVV